MAWNRHLGALLLTCSLLEVGGCTPPSSSTPPAELTKAPAAPTSSASLSSDPASKAGASLASPIPASTNPASASPSAFSPGYNVVLISLDALRARETSLFGYGRDTTPHLKALAQTSVVLDQAVAPGSWTLPSTMSIFTGYYPSVHGVVNKLMPNAQGELKDSQLTSTLKTLPQYLHEAGYLLAGFTGDAGVSARFGFGRDFDTFVDDLKFGGLDHSQPAACAWIEAHKQQKFFVFLHGYDCHGQYDPPEGYRRTFAGDYRGRLHGTKDEQAGFRERALRNKFVKGSSGEPHLDASEFSLADGRFYQALYDEKIQRADKKLGEFMTFMDRQGLTNKTIFVILADHGEEFLEHGNIDHGPTLYQEMVHVPVLIKIPGQKPMHVRNRVSSMDALPTVLELLKVPTPRLDAVSLLPLLQGRPMTLPTVYSETDYRLFGHKRACFEGDRKMVVSLDSGRVELYDLAHDPQEQHALPWQSDPQGPRLKQTLETWVNSLPRRYESYQVDSGDIIKIF